MPRRTHESMWTSLTDSIVDKDATTEEKEWAKQQKTVGAIAHLTLQAME